MKQKYEKNNTHFISSNTRILDRIFFRKQSKRIPMSKNAFWNNRKIYIMAIGILAFTSLYFTGTNTVKGAYTFSEIPWTDDTSVFTFGFLNYERFGFGPFTFGKTGSIESFQMTNLFKANSNNPPARAMLNIYKGGGNPDGGTLVATAYLTYASTTAKANTFWFFENPFSVTSSTQTYFMRFAIEGVDYNNDGYWPYETITSTNTGTMDLSQAHIWVRSGPGGSSPSWSDNGGSKWISGVFYGSGTPIPVDLISNNSELFSTSTWDPYIEDCTQYDGPFLSSSTINAFSCGISNAFGKITRFVFVPHSFSLNFFNTQISNFTSVFPFSVFYNFTNTIQSKIENFSASSTSLIIPGINNFNIGNITILTSSSLANTVGTSAKNTWFVLITNLTWIVVAWKIFKVFI